MPTMSSDFAGQSVLITGASKGIGQRAAIRFGEAGAKVAVNYNSDQKGAKETVGAIKACGGAAVAIQADLSAAGEARKLICETVDELGGLDILVNNAAVPGWSPFFDVTEELWDEVLNANLRAAFFASQAAGEHMRDTGRGGRIINCSSLVSHLPLPGLGPYTASKSGIEGLTAYLMVELAKFSINVNCVCIGATVTERNLADDPDYDANWGKVVPLGRAGTTDDMVDAIFFFASDASRYITGQTLVVDGGWSRQGHPGGKQVAIHTTEPQKET